MQAEEYVGCVPVIVSLSEMDCTVPKEEKPPPLSYLLPRTTVLMAIRDEVEKFFSPFVTAQGDTPRIVWFTYGGEPVPWQYPVGAIKDSITALKLLEGSATDTTAPLKFSARLPSPAELNVALFAAPLTLEARISCVTSEKPVGVPCPGQEGAATDRCGEQAVRDYLKQMVKGTYSAMYGTIRAIMDARNEVISDMLNFAMCTHPGEPLVRASRVHNERVAVLRQVAKNISYVAVMINIPLSSKPLHFSLFRVPALARWRPGGSTCKREQQMENPRGAAEGAPGCDKYEVGDFELTFGEVIWRTLLLPCLRVSKQASVEGSPEEPAAPFFRSLLRFYEGLDEVSASSGGGEVCARECELVGSFILCGNSDDDAEGIRVTFPSAPNLRRRLGFVVQGTRPPLDTPWKYLLERFSSADGRLYITLTVF